MMIIISTMYAMKENTDEVLKCIESDKLKKEGHSFTFYNLYLPTGAELVLEAEELLLPQAGAEDGSFNVIPFKVLALNVDFDFKIDLTVFGPEPGLAQSNFFSRRRGLVHTEDSLAYNQSDAGDGQYNSLMD
ncbi:hypothetical protein Tco_0781645 [Tanacetum coccineum]